MSTPARCLLRWRAAAVAGRNEAHLQHVRAWRSEQAKARAECTASMASLTARFEGEVSVGFCERVAATAEHRSLAPMLKAVEAFGGGHAELLESLDEAVGRSLRWWRTQYENTRAPGMVGPSTLVAVPSSLPADDLERALEQVRAEHAAALAAARAAFVRRYNEWHAQACFELGMPTHSDAHAEGVPGASAGARRGAQVAAELQAAFAKAAVAHAKTLRAASDAFDARMASWRRAAVPRDRPVGRTVVDAIGGDPAARALPMSPRAINLPQQPRVGKGTS